MQNERTQLAAGARQGGPSAQLSRLHPYLTIHREDFLISIKHAPAYPFLFYSLLNCFFARRED